MEETNIPENGFYVHYKHNPADEDKFNYVYEVVGIGRNTEEKTYTVLYRPLYKNDWMPPANYQSRPLGMFMEDVTIDGKTVPRFTRIADADTISELEAIRADMY